MKPADFDYHAPGELEEALALLGALDDVKVLAGGQSLMPMMNFRYLAPAHLIDLNRVAGLAGIEERESEVRIGAMTRQRDLLDSEVIARRVPLMRDALMHVGHLPTRNRGTLGGSLSHLDPAAELPAVLCAMEALLEVRSLDGQREIHIDDWCQGYMTTAMQPDELLVGVRIPNLPAEAAGHGHAFVEVARRLGDFALAGAGVVVSRAKASDGSIDDCRVALTGVDVGPVRLREAEDLLLAHTGPPTAALLQAAAETARNVPGLDDVHASAHYRRKLAVVTTRRALSQALDVAAGSDSV